MGKSAMSVQRAYEKAKEQREAPVLTDEGTFKLKHKQEQEALTKKASLKTGLQGTNKSRVCK